MQRQHFLLISSTSKLVRTLLRPSTALMASSVESPPVRVGHPQGHKLLLMSTLSCQRDVSIANKGASGHVVALRLPSRTELQSDRWIRKTPQNLPNI